MKKGIAILALAATTVAVQAEGPTIYGLINKGLVMTSQEDVAMKKEWTGATDIQNKESRMGLKGTFKTAMAEGTYKMELGINSDYDDAGRIRIRQSKVGLKTKFGTVTMGQTYAPMGAMLRESDLFEATLLSSKGNDQKRLVSNAVNSIGMHDTGRADLISYTSPNLHGLTITLSEDRGNESGQDLTGTDRPDASSQMMARYQRNIGGIDTDLYYIMRNTNGANTDEGTRMGANFAMNNMKLAFAMGSAEEKATAASVKEETDRMYVGFSYGLNEKTTLGVNYQTQTGFIVSHMCNKNFTVNLTYAMYEFESKTALTGDAKTAVEADASMLGLHLGVKF
jgi:hypothetical protein